MKTFIQLSAVLVIILTGLFSCTEKSENDGANRYLEIDGLDPDAFAIYLAKNPVPYNNSTDYSSFDINTVELADVPLLTSSAIESYDSVDHIISLKEQNSLLSVPSTSVQGQMFVVTLNKKPVYCGFLWPIYSSVGCSWITIEYPFGINGLENEQIQIREGWSNENDPRNNVDIFNYLDAIIADY
jgi:hypothetical protein